MHSIFGALALVILNNEAQEAYVMKKVRDEMSRMYCSGKFPMRLNSFKNQRQLFTSFNNKPYLKEFHRV